MGFRGIRGLAVTLAASVLMLTCTASAQAQVLTAQRVANGLSRPLYVTMPPDDTDRLFIVEQHTGNILIYDRNTETILGTEFLTVGGISTGGEQGLLGLAFDPDYDTNGFFYVNYTAGDGSTHVDRYEVSGDPNVADSGSATPVLSFAQPQSNHNGGWIGFGPDGYLYISSGDGGAGNDSGSGHTEPGGNGQDIEDNLLGKILRIDVGGDDFPGDSNRNYAIPPTNPFVGVTGDDEIWSYGLRNPWRASFDSLTGDLYIGDVGQNTREEIDVQPAASTGGENYGWRLREGTIATPSGGVGGPKPLGAIDPIHEYTHSDGISITGGYVYRGPIPVMQGRYFFADFTGRIWSLVFDGSAPASFDGTNFTDLFEHTGAIILDAGSIDQVASFGEDPDGNLFIVDLDGEIFQITDAPTLGDTDHFKLFKVRGTSGAPKFIKFGPVTLADQFGSEEYNVLKVAALGLPADKNGEGVNDATTHLAEYQVKAVEGSPKFAKISDVRVINQCNALYVQVTKPASLLVPSLKNLVSQPLPPDPGSHDLDHFLCYKARVQSKLSNGTPVAKLPKGMQVDVVDQFDGMTSRRYDLKRVTKLCNPVDKSGAPVFLAGDNEGDPKPITPATIDNPDDHLVCYKAVLARKTIAQSGCVPATPGDSGTEIVPPQVKHTKVLGAFINNQFGPSQLDSQREVELCIPSLKIYTP
jgi:glucose/arabinose dehydrogenase